jgi:hypothetical protein
VKPIFFIHVPRSGGTTLAKIIQRQYGPRRTFKIDVRGTSGDTREAWQALDALDPRVCNDLRVVHGHQNFGCHRAYFPDATYITLLRDPVDRLVSYYYYVLVNTKHYLHPLVASNRLKLRDFAFCRASAELDNGQTRQISGQVGVPIGACSQEMLDEAKANLVHRFAVFGLTERFDEAVVLMKRAFGWSLPYYVKSNTLPGRQARSDLPGEVVDAICESNPYDTALYAFARDKFDEMVMRQGLVFRAELAALRAVNGILRFVERVAR